MMTESLDTGLWIGASVSLAHGPIRVSENHRINYPDRHWQDAIRRPAATQMIHLRRLIEALPLVSRIPDQKLLASEPGHRGSHIRATRDEARRFGLVLVPNTQTVDVRMDALAGPRLKAHWFDPRLGTMARIGEFDASGARAFTTPDHGPDWVLALEATHA